LTSLINACSSIATIEFQLKDIVVTVSILKQNCWMAIPDGQEAIKYSLRPVHTVGEKCDCHRCLAVFCDSRTFLRQCGQGFTSAAHTSRYVQFDRVFTYIVDKSCSIRAWRTCMFSLQETCRARFRGFQGTWRVTALRFSAAWSLHPGRHWLQATCVRRRQTTANGKPLNCPLKQSQFVCMPSVCVCFYLTICR